MFTQKFPWLFSFYGSCRSASPVLSAFAIVASLQAMPWPLIGSSGGRKSIDCQSTKVDCLQCFYHLNSCGISSERTEEGCVSSCSGFIKAERTKCSTIECLRALWKSGTNQQHTQHTALINSLGGQLSIPVPSRILLEI